MIMTKNIHILPTQNNKSKLAKYHYDGSKNIKVGELGLQINNYIGWSNCWSEKELYITNDEEIKEGDWFITDKNTICKCVRVDWKYAYSIEAGSRSKNNCKKIILTTDQELIKYGVQAIDDAFLEWFVKNPSCEEVEVTYGVLKPFQSEDKGYLIHCPDNEVLEEPKQETLEEAAEIITTTKFSWQQERSYSEEEVIELVTDYEYAKFNSSVPLYFTQWFEQFKKK